MSDDKISFDERNPLPTIFQLLVRQQRVSKQTNRLVESMIADVSKAREQSERIAILTNRIETVERTILDFDRKRSECIASMVDQMRELEAKREANKDRIAFVEQELTRQIAAIRSEFARELQRSDEEMREKVDQSVNPVESIVAELREKIAFNAGKYGGIVDLVISILMMLLQWVITHPPHSKP